MARHLNHPGTHGQRKSLETELIIIIIIIIIIIKKI